LPTYLGLKVVGAPDVRAERGASWSNVSGFKIGFITTEERFIDTVTIELADE